MAHPSMQGPMHVPMQMQPPSMGMPQGLWRATPHRTPYHAMQRGLIQPHLMQRPTPHHTPPFQRRLGPMEGPPIALSAPRAGVSRAAPPQPRWDSGSEGDDRYNDMYADVRDGGYSSYDEVEDSGTDQGQWSPEQPSRQPPRDLAPVPRHGERPRGSGSSPARYASLQTPEKERNRSEWVPRSEARGGEPPRRGGGKIRNSGLQELHSEWVNEYNSMVW